MNLTSVRFSCANSYHFSNFDRVELWFLQICSRSVPQSPALLFRELRKCTLVFLMPSSRCLGTSDLFILCFSDGRWLDFFIPCFSPWGEKHTLYISKVYNLHFYLCMCGKMISRVKLMSCLWPHCLMCHKLSYAIVSLQIQLHANRSEWCLLLS